MPSSCSSKVRFINAGNPNSVSVEDDSSRWTIFFFSPPNKVNAKIHVKESYSNLGWMEPKEIF